MSKILTRKSHNRLPGYDYSQPNYYFLTTCTENRKEWFGEIKNNTMILNLHGQICQASLQNLPNYHNTIKIDTFIIMPNHVHVIIIINGYNFNKLSGIDIGNGNGQALGLSLHNLSLHNLSLHNLSPHNLSLHNQNISLPRIMRDFKSFSSREINKTINNSCEFKWQRSFHDHIIRNDKSLNNIREYIITNPSAWDKDVENPINIGNMELNKNCITKQYS